MSLLTMDTEPGLSLPEHEPASDQADPMLGRAVGKYELVRVIGRGGMGCVYEALNKSIGKRVAIKLIDRELTNNAETIERFQREAQAAGAVESDHIIEIFDVGTTDDGLPFIVMELLRGEDLGHRIRRQGRLELVEALPVVAQILRGLARAHESGIVHRDLKPDNVFLVDREDDTTLVKILDFGISKIVRRPGLTPKTLTKDGVVLGTPYYMSPEQAQGLADVDERADLWSVGAILFECLTGRPPHTGATYEQVIVRICMHDADDVRLHNPAVPEPVAEVLAQALARDRDARFSSARDLLDALAQASGGLVSLRRADGTPTPTGRAVISLARQSRASDVGLGPTVEVPTPRLGGPDELASPARVEPARVEKGAAERTKKRSRVAAAASSLLLGVVGAALYMKLGLAGSDAAPAIDEPRAAAQREAAREASTLAARGDGPSPRASGAPTLARLVLSANAPSARFLVDGEELSGGELVGRTGERVRVRIEARGYEPLHADVVFDGSPSRRFELVPAPAASAAGAARATSSPRVEHGRPPTAKASPAQSASGVAPGLTLRKE